MLGATVVLGAPVVLGATSGRLRRRTKHRRRDLLSVPSPLSAAAAAAAAPAAG